MSILIKGINPPKSCYTCSWYNKVECPVNDGRYYYRVQRHPACPLVEIPTPHGRLGDLDELYKVANMADDFGADTTDILKLIIDTPTVIEAEGREE